MSTNIICAKCNGHGYIPRHDFEASKFRYELCDSCWGEGHIKIISDDIIIEEDMVYITKKEYNELLEYKYMYENLCK